MKYDFRDHSLKELLYKSVTWLEKHPGLMYSYLFITSTLFSVFMKWKQLFPSAQTEVREWHEVVAAVFMGLVLFAAQFLAKEIVLQEYGNQLLAKVLPEVSVFGGTLGSMATHRGSAHFQLLFPTLLPKDRQLPAESARKIFKEWSDRYSRGSESADLWHLMAALYMFEENYDISDSKFATNLRIYSDVLLAYYGYFLKRYGKNARIFVFSTYLPSQWYLRNARTHPEDFSVVENYRDQLCKLLADCRSKRGAKKQPRLDRYIGVASSDKERETYDIQTAFELQKDISDFPEKFKQYQKELHYDDTRMKMVLVDRVCKSNVTIDIKDLVVFGHGDKWVWGIQSNLILSHPVMFLSLYDAADLAKPIRENISIESFIQSVEHGSTQIMPANC
jgi:hypothetical protein